MSKILHFPGTAHPDGRPAELRRSPDESLYDYLKRVGRANEREIERLNRSVWSLETSIVEASQLIARRFRQLIYLEAVAASFLVAAVMLLGKPSGVTQILLLVAIPLGCVGGGMGFLAHAAEIEAFLAKLVSWRRR